MLCGPMPLWGGDGSRLWYPSPHSPQSAPCGQVWATQREADGGDGDLLVGARTPRGTAGARRLPPPCEEGTRGWPLPAAALNAHHPQH